MAKITFKGKIETLRYIDNTIASVRIKVPTLERRHCDMTAFRTHPKYGAYANSDLFVGMLSRIKKERLGEYIKMDAVPEGVTVDQNGFLAVVTIDV